MRTRHRPIFSRILPGDRMQVASLMATTAEFFGTEHEPAQIPADLATFDKLMRLSADTLGVNKDEDGRIVAWCMVVPTTTALMRSFLKREITERTLFDRTQAGDSGALYVMAAYMLPAYRATTSPTALIWKTIAPFMEQDPALFYDAWTAAGARLGVLMKKRYALESYRIASYAEAPVA
jgi:hypothetical protein